jgi:putative tricarboxylic transport membrane protein
VEILHSMGYGFSVALQPENIFFVLIGCLLGTLVGVLPGLGPIAAISMLLPVTFKIPTASAIIMLAGLYYGAQYGGSTTSILVNVPGEASSVMTCLDGYQMARQGRAGPALGIAAIGSFIAGTVAVIGLMIFAKPLAVFALKFGSPEYFALLLLGLTFVTYFSRGSLIKALAMACLGLILSNVGIDAVTATPRLTFGELELSDGINIASLGIGLFGIGEILITLEKRIKTEVLKTRLTGFLPTKADWKLSIGAILRGTGIGFFLGNLPGGGPVFSTFMSYGVEKRFSKHPERFGQGAIEGVAGPESANNAAATSSFIPLLTLGVPTSAVLSLMFGALLIHGVTPGPFLLKENPDVFWGVVCSMYIGNAMLLVLNLPLIPMWVQVLRIPAKWLYPFILLFCLVGAYSIDSSNFDVYLTVAFGILGYFMRKFGFEPAPLILACVLGRLIELNLRQSLLMSGGSFSIFFTRPIAAVTMTAVILVLLSAIFPFFKKVKKKVEKLED